MTNCVCIVMYPLYSISYNILLILELYKSLWIVIEKLLTFYFSFVNWKLKHSHKYTCTPAWTWVAISEFEKSFVFLCTLYTFSPVYMTFPMYFSSFPLVGVFWNPFQIWWLHALNFLCVHLFFSLLLLL